MISHELQFIFIHIPKTSGNSLSLFLQKYLANTIIQRDSNRGKNQGIDVICEKTKKDIKHEKIAYYYKMYPNKTKQYFKFTIVRNPYDRILSFYFWSKRNAIYNRTEFIKFIKENKDFQYDYIMHKGTHHFHIVHYENMMEELKQLPVFKEKDKDISFEKYPVLNASENSKKRFQDRYDKELQDLVYNKWKKDFELFGYSYAMPS